jgi:hypothetical protein
LWPPAVGQRAAPSDGGGGALGGSRGGRGRVPPRLQVLRARAYRLASPTGRPIMIIWHTFALKKGASCSLLLNSNERAIDPAEGATRLRAVSQAQRSHLGGAGGRGATSCRICSSGGGPLQDVRPAPTGRRSSSSPGRLAQNNPSRGSGAARLLARGPPLVVVVIRADGAQICALWQDTES